MRRLIANVVRSANREAFIDADRDFHRLIVAAAHNPVISELLGHLSVTIDRSVRLVVNHATGQDDSWGLQLHADLAGAIRAGLAEDAAQAAVAVLDWSDHALGVMEANEAAVEQDQQG